MGPNLGGEKRIVNCAFSTGHCCRTGEPPLTELEESSRTFG